MAADYITPEGYRRLEAELDHLYRVERRKVTAEVAAAAALGDRSENAEYIYGKRRLREIDRRIRFLSRRLDQLTVVDRPPPRRDRVYFGAWVTVIEDDVDEPAVYRLVGPDESDPSRGEISLASPLGRALLGRALGDALEVRLPRGKRRLEIVGLDYDPPAGRAG